MLEVIAAVIIAAIAIERRLAAMHKTQIQIEKHLAALRHGYEAERALSIEDPALVP